MAEPIADSTHSPARKTKDPGEDVFKQQQIFLLLSSISAAKDGATGYDLQKKVPIPRSTVYRFLAELEVEGSVTFSKHEHDGRLQKRYRVTDHGQERIAEIRAAISGNVAAMYKLVSSVRAVPIPPDLIGLLDYSRIESAVHDATSKEGLLTDLHQLEGLLSMALNFHEGILVDMKARHALLSTLINDASEIHEPAMATVKARLEGTIARDKTIAGNDIAGIMMQLKT
jgi:DNA-binding PadR family transcriptional regulator